MEVLRQERLTIVFYDRMDIVKWWVQTFFNGCVVKVCQVAVVMVDR